MKTLFYLCLLNLLVAPSHYLWANESQPKQLTNDTFTFIEKDTISDAIDPFIKGGFEGVISVSNETDTLYQKAVGFSIEGEKHYTMSTVVDIASVSKQFTAAAIMKLVEQGQLKTSSLVSDYVSGIPDDKASITVHHLLTHTAGFKRHLGKDEDKLVKEAFIKKALDAPLAFAVGETYHYSNIGYQLLAYLVEEVSGDTFETYLFENLLKPADMFSTGYLRPDWSQRTIPEVKRLYAGFASPLTMMKSTDGDFWNLLGGGGILSTANDMHLWHKALQEEKVLSKESQSIMYTPHVNENEEGYYYGYGWSVVPREGKEPLIWHNGMSFFGKAEYWRLPESGIMIFVASHKGDVSPWHVAHAIYKALNL